VNVNAKLQMEKNRRTMMGHSAIAASSSATVPTSSSSSSSAVTSMTAAPAAATASHVGMATISSDFSYSATTNPSSRLDHHNSANFSHASIHSESTTEPFQNLVLEQTRQVSQHSSATFLQRQASARTSLESFANLPQVLDGSSSNMDDMSSDRAIPTEPASITPGAATAAASASAPTLVVVGTEPLSTINYDGSAAGGAVNRDMNGSSSHRRQPQLARGQSDLSSSSSSSLAGHNIPEQHAQPQHDDALIAMRQSPTTLAQNKNAQSQNASIVASSIPTTTKKTHGRKPTPNSRFTILPLDPSQQIPKHAGGVSMTSTLSSSSSMPVLSDHQTSHPLQPKTPTPQPNTIATASAPVPAATTQTVPGETKKGRFLLRPVSSFPNVVTSSNVSTSGGTATAAPSIRADEAQTDQGTSSANTSRSNTPQKPRQTSDGRQTSTGSRFKVYPVTQDQEQQFANGGQTRRTTANNGDSSSKESTMPRSPKVTREKGRFKITPVDPDSVSQMSGLNTVKGRERVHSDATASQTNTPKMGSTNPIRNESPPLQNLDATSMTSNSPRIISAPSKLQQPALVANTLAGVASNPSATAASTPATELNGEEIQMIPEQVVNGIGDIDTIKGKPLVVKEKKGRFTVLKEKSATKLTKVESKAPVVRKKGRFVVTSVDCTTMLVPMNVATTVAVDGPYRVPAQNSQQQQQQQQTPTAPLAQQSNNAAPQESAPIAPSQPVIEQSQQPQNMSTYQQTYIHLPAQQIMTMPSQTYDNGRIVMQPMMSPLTLQASGVPGPAPVTTYVENVPTSQPIGQEYVHQTGYQQVITPMVGMISQPATTMTHPMNGNDTMMNLNAPPASAMVGSLSNNGSGNNVQQSYQLGGQGNPVQQTNASSRQAEPPSQSVNYYLSNPAQQETIQNQYVNEQVNTQQLAPAAATAAIPSQQSAHDAHPQRTSPTPNSQQTNFGANAAIAAQIPPLPTTKGGNEPPPPTTAAAPGTTSVTKQTIGKSKPPARPTSNGTNTDHNTSSNNKTTTTTKAYDSRGNYGVVGLGKAFHLLEQLKLEVTGGDRSIKNLHIDLKLLRDKNKDLESKNRELDRKYKDERKAKEAAEKRLFELKKQLKAIQDKEKVVRNGESTTASTPTTQNSSGNNAAKTTKKNASKIENGAKKVGGNGWSNATARPNGTQQRQQQQQQYDKSSKTALPSKAKTAATSTVPTSTVVKGGRFANKSAEHQTTVAAQKLSAKMVPTKTQSASAATTPTKSKATKSNFSMLNPAMHSSNLRPPTAANAGAKAAAQRGDMYSEHTRDVPSVVDVFHNEDDATLTHARSTSSGLDDSTLFYGGQKPTNGLTAGSPFSSFQHMAFPIQSMEMSADSRMTPASQATYNIKQQVLVVPLQQPIMPVSYSQPVVSADAMNGQYTNAQQQGNATWDGRQMYQQLQQQQPSIQTIHPPNMPTMPRQTTNSRHKPSHSSGSGFPPPAHAKTPSSNSLPTYTNVSDGLVHSGAGMQNNHVAHAHHTQQHYMFQTTTTTTTTATQQPPMQTHKMLPPPPPTVAAMQQNASLQRGVSETSTTAIPASSTGNGLDPFNDLMKLSSNGGS